MDLSFARWNRETVVTVLPTELAVLMVGVAARQAASRTARLQARLTTVSPQFDLLAPANGAFNRGAATTLTCWQEE